MSQRGFLFWVVLLSSIGSLRGQTTQNELAPDVEAQLRKEAEIGDSQAWFALADALLHEDSPRARDEGLKWMQRAADAGHAEAQIDLGAMYRTGNIPPKDEQKAFAYFSKAAAQGSSAAYNEVGLCLLKGTGVSEDREAAIGWFRKGAEAGDAPAEYNLGATLFVSAPNTEQRQEAFRWMEASAEHGYEFAQEIVGTRYLGLDGIERNPDKALKYLLPFAEGGNRKYQSIVGSLYLDKKSPLYDTSEGARWVLASVDSKDGENDDEYQSSPGILYKAALLLATATGTPRDGPRALRLATKAAEAGDADAYTLIGEMHSLGLGIPQNFPLALKNFHLGLDHGSVSAEGDLGEMYLSGRGVERDPEQAFKYLLNAAERNLPIAQRDLGTYYLQFPIGNPNYKEAARWILSAHANGDPGAAGPMGLIYANGYGVERDEARAIRFFELAIEGHQHGTALSLNGLAWILCTSRNPSLRDPQRALGLARRAAELARDQVPSIIDTWAAAQAANDDFASAIVTERRALQIEPQNQDFKRHLQQFLDRQKIVE